MRAHGIMFHHFHGESHPVGQGSISQMDLERMLVWLKRSFRLLNAIDFLDRSLSGTLTDRDICLTFDDSLLCQYEIASPVLDSEDLTAFYFVYSSAFVGRPDMLEIYRYFRSTEYPDFDEFCDDFIAHATSHFEALITSALANFDPDNYLTDCPFYSRSDKVFRFIRDRVLSPTQYAYVMRILMDTRNFDTECVKELVFMTPDHLRHLAKQGNLIGLHSHTHPLDMGELSSTQQFREWSINYSFLASTLGEPPRSMSHPMGRYNPTTLAILSDLGIQIGFRASLSVPVAPSLLEIPREDR